VILPRTGLLACELAWLRSEVLRRIPARSHRRTESLFNQCSKNPGVSLAVVPDLAQRQPHLPMLVLGNQKWLHWRRWHEFPFGGWLRTLADVSKALRLSFVRSFTEHPSVPAPCIRDEGPSKHQDEQQDEDGERHVDHGRSSVCSWTEAVAARCCKAITAARHEPSLG